MTCDVGICMSCIIFGLVFRALNYCTSGKMAYPRKMCFTISFDNTTTSEAFKPLEHLIHMNGALQEIIINSTINDRIHSQIFSTSQTHGSGSLSASSIQGIMCWVMSTIHCDWEHSRVCNCMVLLTQFTNASCVVSDSKCHSHCFALHKLSLRARAHTHTQHSWNK